MHTVVTADTLIHAGAVDDLILATCFAFVLGIGFVARRQVSASIDLFLSARSPPVLFGVAMMPFHYRSEVRSVPGRRPRRTEPPAPPTPRDHAEIHMDFCMITGLWGSRTP